MARILQIITLGALALISWNAYGQTRSTLKAEDLLGEWQFVKLDFQMAGGKKWDESSFNMKLLINAADNEIFEGKYVFQSLTHDAHDGKQNVKAREIDLLGTISLSGDKLFFVIVGEADSVFYEGRILNEHTIEWLGYESGEHGWILRGVSIKQ